MITCNLMGGLGNQLFQIFTTISLSIKTTNSFIFSNTETLDNGKRHTYWDTILFRLKPFLRPFFHKMNILKEQGESSIDYLCSQSSLSMSKTASALLNLEFEGIVKNLPGKLYKLI